MKPETREVLEALYCVLRADDSVLALQAEIVDYLGGEGLETMEWVRCRGKVSDGLRELKRLGLLCESSTLQRGERVPIYGLEDPFVVEELLGIGVAAPVEPGVRSRPSALAERLSFA